MLYTIDDKRITPIKQIDFKLERSLQNLVEKNLDVLFNLDFLASEFVLKNFRYDSVAYDKDNNSFVIIEYKRGKNESLVDQGYAYLNTALDRKSDLVLLYNKINNQNMQVTDFDWSALRVFFISPKFTTYQKTATGYQKMPFRLFEINKFKNNIILVNEINNEKIIDNPIVTSSNSPIGKVSKEIKVYSEEDHCVGLSQSLIDLYYSLRERILALGNIDIKPTKLYIAFKVGNTNITDIEMFKSYLKVFINVKKGQLDDILHKAKDISNVGHHGNGNYCFNLKNDDDLEYLLSLIKQSYRINTL